MSQLYRFSRLSWTKSFVPISFPSSGIRIPGSSKRFRVIGTCHHTGSLHSGHWFTKVVTNSGTWFELDDLKPSSLQTSSPGLSDSTVVILVLVAEDMLS